VNRLRANSNIIRIYKTFDLANGLAMEGERNWTFLLEIEKTDIVGVETVQVQQQ
jgi:hypothetical protein